MVIAYRIPAPEQWAEFIAPVGIAFGDPGMDEAELEAERKVWEPDRSIAAVDGDQWVGGAAAFTFDLTLPGGAAIPVAGVTMVGVAPTHRRRGVLTELMGRQLDDVVARGEALAVLTASESGIYGRFGYGPATSAAEVKLTTARSSFVAPIEVPGAFQLVPAKEARPALMAAYDRSACRRAGAISRSERYWDRQLADLPSDRHGAEALHCLVHVDGGGEPDGYAVYRYRPNWDDGLPNHVVAVSDLGGASDDVEAAVWRFLLDLDLVGEVVGRARPLDDPVRWRLTEPRRLRTTEAADWLWVRVLDVAVALTARTYRVADSLVIEVVDRFRPAGGGRFRLDAGLDRATCAPTDAAADLTLGSGELGSLLLGGVAPSTLAAAGRLDEHTPHALARADLLFPTSPLPFCATMF